MEFAKVESLGQLRHDLRTPVNHILGYCDLLIEEASERHLEAFVPAFQEIQSGGLRLLTSIRTTLDQKALDERAAALDQLDIAGLRESLEGTAAEALETSRGLLALLESGHRQTVADLGAISGALRLLLDFAHQGSRALARSREVLQAYQLPDGFRRPERKGGGGRILIADDDSGNRDLLRRRVESEGHEVVAEVANGQEVLEFLTCQRCDLILLDVMMPVMDGIHTLAHLKQDPQLRIVPVIMISALDEMRRVVHCIEIGAEDYLPKPFNRVLLRARIGACLEKKWLRDRERQKAQELEQTLRLLETAQAQLEIQASQDSLTGLANRRSIDGQLELRRQRGTPFCVIYIDLNGFKRINDTYGHQAGDELLRLVGDRLRTAFRSTDVVGRWGGDEFVALVDADIAIAEARAGRIAECFVREFAITVGDATQKVAVAAAIGIAPWKPGQSSADVLQSADASMYLEKMTRHKAR